jgi:maleylacetoacetate isomerase
MSDVVLYGFWRSSSSHRVRIALAYKDIHYTLRSVHLGRREQLEPPYLDINPAGQIPALEHDGTVITQSVAILQYLDLRWPDRPVFPREPRAAARVWEIVERVNSFLQPYQMPGSVRRALVRHIDHPPESVDAGVGRFVHAQLRAGLEELEARVARAAGRYCVGDAVTAADMVVVPQLDGAERFGIPLDGLDTLLGVRARCMALDCFQTSAAENQPDRP